MAGVDWNWVLPSSHLGSDTPSGLALIHQFPLRADLVKNRMPWSVSERIPLHYHPHESLIFTVRTCLRSQNCAPPHPQDWVLLEFLTLGHTKPQTVQQLQFSATPCTDLSLQSQGRWFALCPPLSSQSSKSCCILFIIQNCVMTSELLTCRTGSSLPLCTFQLPLTEYNIVLMQFSPLPRTIAWIPSSRCSSYFTFFGNSSWYLHNYDFCLCLKMPTKGMEVS